ncbi:IS110 family transposase [Paraburkholderia sp. CNPSo 3281]|uniref:IS110 family transposase n=1 Tax=Paraburkholderia sp. CNPSo 3281 TaxID=2940933 RepID=UPI0035CD06D2
MKKTKPLYHGHRFLSLRDVEELMLELGVVVTYETIRCWCEKFGARFARYNIPEIALTIWIEIRGQQTDHQVSGFGKLAGARQGLPAAGVAAKCARVDGAADLGEASHGIDRVVALHLDEQVLAVGRGKNDAADAAAICEAVTRPSMRFVPLKDEHQQATICLHRTRQGFIEERTATYNRARGLLSEFGVVLPQSPERLRREIPAHLDALPGWARRCISDLLEHASNIEARLAEYDRAISEIARDDGRSRRLMHLRGIGPPTASALLASIGAGHDFRNGRQVAAWIGLTPSQYSSGGKTRLGGITKTGDAYLRNLLILGARSVMASLGDKQDRFSRWVRSVVERRGYWRAAVAIAAKNARTAWAMLKYGEAFKHEPAAV